MTDLREDTRAIQKRLGSTPFPDDLQGIADDAGEHIQAQAATIKALEKLVVQSFLEGFNVAGSMTPHLNDILPMKNKAWLSSKTFAALASAKETT